MTLQLRPYQIEGRDFLAARTRALLADEMRVGKTPQAILAAEKIGARRILAVCPAIAVPQWEAEFRRWWNGLWPELLVLSYDKARNSLDDLRRMRFDVCIIDECHFAKNPDALRTKMVYGKNGLAWVSGRIWVLSGTPAPKHAAELWPMLRAFGATKMRYPDFVQRYCYSDWVSGRILGTKEKMIPELREILAPIMLRRTRKQVAPDMPAIDFQFLEIGGAHPDYDAGETGLGERPVTPGETRQEVAMAKVTPLAEHVSFALDNGLVAKTVVFGWHVAPLQELAHHLGGAALTGQTSAAQRSEIQEQFRTGELDVVCAQILAAGTAIDLSAASHGFFLELDWVPGNNMQAANRLISMQKAEPVSFDIVTWPGSVDEAVHKTLLRRSRELGKLY